MILKFSKDLKRQEIIANGAELAIVMGKDKDDKGNRIYDYSEDRKLSVGIIKNPVLVTDVFKISKFNPTTRDSVFKLYESPKRTTEYNGVSVDFEQNKYKGAWGPSIDTLLFCRAINKITKELNKVETLVEIGAGSGFISKYLLEKFPNIKEATLIDLNPNAINCCRDNIKDERVKFVVGNALEYLKDKKFDLIVCNPPYIPRPKSIDDNPYEGVGLLRYLINNSKELLNEKGLFVTNISSLCKKEVSLTIKDSKLKSRVIDKMNVPLKVCNVLNNKKWIKYLETKGLKKRLKNGYEYYQDIIIVKIEK